MIRKSGLLVLALALILMMIAGCQGEGGAPPAGQKLEGKDVPEYKALLNVTEWANEFDPEALGMTEEEREGYEAFEKAVGLWNWEHVSLEAKEADGSIGVRTVAKFTGAEDTLMAHVSKIQPAQSKIVKNLSRNNLVGMYAVGNYEGGINAAMDWLMEGESFKGMLDDFGGEEASSGWEMMKPMVTGIRETLKEEAFPYIGDELVFAVFANEDFIGWDEIHNAETLTETMPIRFIGALSLEKAGFADSIGDIVENIIMATPLGMMVMMAGEEMDLLAGAEHKSGDGYDITYFDLEDDVLLGWAEYEGGLFISDLDTLEKLPDFYTPGNPAKDAPAEYNFYCMLDFDTCISEFYEPNKEMAAEIVEEIRVYEEEEEAADMVEEIFSIIDAGEKFGAFEMIGYNSPDGAVGSIKMSSAAGPLVLKIRDAWTMLMGILEEQMPSEEMMWEMEGGTMGSPGGADDWEFDFNE
jgi:hypothetical protein